MMLNCSLRTPRKTSNSGHIVRFIDTNVFLSRNFAQFNNPAPFNTWILNKPSKIVETLNKFNYSNNSMVSTGNSLNSWVVEERNCDLSFGVPLIFSISPEAEDFILNNALKGDVLDVCNRIASFVSGNHLVSIGEIAVFQEDGAEPKLFITYGIANKTYRTILGLWNEACKKLAENIPIESLQKIAIVFDQL